MECQGNRRKMRWKLYSRKVKINGMDIMVGIACECSCDRCERGVVDNQGFRFFSGSEGGELAANQD